MPDATLNRVLDYLRRAVTPTDSAEDGDILRRFVARHEETAFADLVRRHGAMVLGVCRRVLDDAHDAEDAFQATFLVLARRAGSVRKPDSVASWLYGVAYRVSCKARTAAALRPQAGSELPEPVASSDPVAEAGWRELRSVIDEELNRLPEKYRAPLVLCYLEGKTNEEAARVLGWTKGTVSGRLARARALLRPRLARRGLALGAAAGAVLLSRSAAPAALMETTIKAALAGGVSAPAATLAQGVLRAMFAKKLMMVSAVVLTLGLVGGGVGFLRPTGPAAVGGEEQKATQQKPGLLFTLPEEPKKEPDDLQKLQGTWQAVALEHNGEKLSADAVKKFRLVIRDNLITFDPDGDKREARFMLGTTSKPKSIWLNSHKAGVVQGIYSLLDGRLTLCVDNDDGKTVPTEFATKAGSGLTLIVMERAKERKTAQEPPKDTERRYSFSMDNKPWKDVIAWFSDITGLAYSGSGGPTGPFSFTPPKVNGELKKYTIAEIVDIINEALQAEPKNRRYILIRGEKTFTFVRGDERIIPDSIPSILIEDLPRYGNTEIVKVDVKLKRGRADAVASELRRMLGGTSNPSGDAIPVEKNNTLVLVGAGEKVRQMLKLLRVMNTIDDTEAKVEPSGRAAKARLTLSGSGSPVRSVAFSPDGKTLWTCPEDCRVSSWDVATGKRRASTGTLNIDGNKCLALAVSPDGKRILVGGAVVPEKGKGADVNMELAGFVAVYSAALDKLIWHHVDFSGPIRAVAFSPDGKRVAAACPGGLVLMDAETDKVIMTLGRAQSGRQTAVAFSPDGGVLAAGGADGSLRFWDVATGQLVRTIEWGRGKVESLAYSPDGDFLLTAGRDQPVRFWDATTGKQTGWLGEGSIHAATISPDGKWYAWGDEQGAVQLYDRMTGNVVGSYQAGTKAVLSVAFSPDGKTLAAGGADGVVKLWDVPK